MYLWENKIKTLWEKLKNEHTVPDGNKNKPWCDKIDYILKTKYPQVLTPLNCEENTSQESSSTFVSPLSFTERCECSQNPVHEIPSQPVQPPETDRTKNLAVTSGFTAAGTLGTLFFLYRVINKQ
ncbi:hypothetical protein PVMG_05938 [Plasmodium vivax Mauritania I]|uniref:Uncharacterized protein n=1 Tax=Plasmodium vivax Mauritania I TaxID=1035515 RepID=A0A0J9VQL5_PLAVI|nr:hypothetical protein PVMG_05938 [Plasmodium vivax Mauritania I]